MYIKFKRNLQHKALIDITSLIDLVFLLVAFFMVTSSLGSESTITVHLPKAVQSGEYKKNKLIISVDKENKIFVNDKPYKREGLLKELKERRKTNSKLTVVIRGDKRADYDTIVSIIDYLNRAGIPKFTLSTVK